MYSQSQQHCDECSGKGKVIDKECMCKNCKAKGITKVNEDVDVPIEVGFPNQEKIVIHGKGNEHPEYKTGALAAELYRLIMWRARWGSNP